MRGFYARYALEAEGCAGCLVAFGRNSYSAPVVLPRTAPLFPAGLSEAACLNSGFWDLFHSAMGEQGRQLAEQGVGLGKPFTTVVEGGWAAGCGWEMGVVCGWEMGVAERGK